MNAIILANLSFSILFLFYWVLLKRLTFFGLNRAYLLFSLGFSALLPLISWPSGAVSSEVLPVVTLPALVVEATRNPAAEPVFTTMIWLYALGAGLALIVVLRSLFLIWKHARQARPGKTAISEYFVSEGHHAFSFFNRIQIGDAVDKDMRDMILSHELVHKRQWHSIDVLFFAVARVIWWFNPLVHLAAREVQLNHEFLADRDTHARFGTNYQHSLLNQALDTRLFPLTNSFFSTSLIKNRILMMNRKTNRKWSLAAYAFALPLIAACLWLGACSEQAGLPDSQQKTVELSNAMTADEPDYNAGEVDVKPSFPGGQEGMLAYFNDGFKYPEELKEGGVEGRVVIGFTVLEDGSLTDVKAVKSDDDRLDAPAEEFVKAMPDWIPGKIGEKNVKVKMMLPVQYSMN